MPLFNAIGPLSNTYKIPNTNTNNDVREHIIKINVTAPTLNVTVYGVNGNGSPVYIDWGDNTASQTGGGPGGQDMSHSYSNTGTYLIKFKSGNGYLALQYPFQLTDIVRWSDHKFHTLIGMFRFIGSYISYITATDRPSPDLSQCVSISAAFANKFFNMPVNHWNVSNVTNMNAAFENNSSFNHPLNSWNVSKVVDMSYMFAGKNIVYQSNPTIFNQSINNWDVSNVTNMSCMFQNSSFNQPLNSWNVGNVTNMSGMFAGNLWEENFGNPSAPLPSRSTPFNQPIGNWSINKVTNMSNMFANCLYNQPLNSWNVTNVTNMSGMFWMTKTFNQPIDSWNVINVTNMSGMFQLAKAFNQPINSWNVSNVTDMNSMFQGTSLFNQPLNSWNVNKVTNVSNMFQESKVFNQNLSSWITGVVSQPMMFSYLANAAWRASSATTYPFLKNGVTRINT